MSQARNIGLLVALGVGWGSTQPLGKMSTMSGLGPFALLFWQLVICTVLLGAMSLARGKGLVLTRRALTFYLVVAVIGTLIPNYTFYAAVTRLPAGIMSILISTVPLIAFPMALALGSERFVWRRFAGLLLGLVGVALIALPGTSLPDPAMVLVLPLAMVGPVFYAMEGTFVSRFGMAGMDPVQAMAGASLAGLILCVPLVLASGEWVDPVDLIAGGRFGRAEVALVLASALHAVIYATYVGMAARTGAVFATQTSYVVTASGLIWSMVLLGESFSVWIWAALAVMLAGLTLVRPVQRV